MFHKRLILYITTLTAIIFSNPTPNYAHGVKWSPFHPYQSYLHIKQHGFQMEKGFFPERMNFWKSQPYPFRDDV